LDSSWNLGSIGIAGPPLRGPSSSRLLAEPPLSPPVSAGASPTASAQPLQPAAPVAPPLAPTPETVSPSSEPSVPVSRPASSLESLLMRFRLITPDQLDEALREQRETGRDVGAIVVERGWINEDQLARLLSYAPAFPGVAEPTSTQVEPEVEPRTETEEQREPELESARASEETEAVAAKADSEPDLQPEPEPEPELPSAGPVISAAATEAPDDASDFPQLPSLAQAHLPPALELVDPELPADSDSHQDPAPAAVVEVAEAAPVLEPSVELVPLAPIVSAPEPIVEPVAEAANAVEATEDLSPEPVSAAAPIAPAFEPVAVPEPVITPEPAAVAEPAPAAAPEIAPEPTVVEPQPQTVKFVEPAAIETIARVFVRLSNGERVEAGSFDDIAAAKARAGEVVRQVSNGGEDWPFFGGRYIRPEAIVSVDVDATVVRYS
jgi:hypothetical protein